MPDPEFDGFPEDTLGFLRDLAANNEREWFAQARPRYEASYKQPAEAFCAAMSARLEKLVREPHTAKIFRIHRDLRFSKDKTPYNAHLHISFAPEHGGASSPGWYFGLEPGQLTLGTGVFDFGKQLETYRESVAGRAGVSLVKQLDTLLARGGRLGEPQLKRVPRGYPADHPRADLLRRKGLAVWIDLASPRAATRPDLVAQCLSAFKQVKPIFDWLRRLEDR